jgi:hypothetical protein
VNDVLGSARAVWIADEFQIHHSISVAQGRIGQTFNKLKLSPFARTGWMLFIAMIL